MRRRFDRFSLAFVPRFASIRCLYRRRFSRRPVSFPSWALWRRKIFDRVRSLTTRAGEREGGAGEAGSRSNVKLRCSLQRVNRPAPPQDRRTKNAILANHAANPGRIAVCEHGRDVSRDVSRPDPGANAERMVFLDEGDVSRDVSRPDPANEIRGLDF